MEIVDNNTKEFLRQHQTLAQSGDDTMNLVRKLKVSLIDNATGTLKAYERVLLIYTIAFVLGILLIVTAVIFGAMDKTILSIAFGAMGLIDIVTYFITIPANKIQESRSNLSQLQVVLLVWLKDFINNDGLMIQQNNIQGGISIEDYQKLTEININNTIKLLRLIEDVAEPKK
ncbi:MAG: hypothetical protein ACKVOW_11700 [Chitinophagaceae bacterium]